MKKDIKTKFREYREAILSEGITPFSYWSFAWIIYFGITFFLSKIYQEDIKYGTTFFGVSVPILLIYFCLQKFKFNLSLDKFIKKYINNNLVFRHGNSSVDAIWMRLSSMR